MTERFYTRHICIDDFLVENDRERAKALMLQWRHTAIVDAWELGFTTIKSETPLTKHSVSPFYETILEFAP